MGSGCIDPRILDFGTSWRWVAASRSGLFDPGARATGTHWIGSWVGLRIVLDMKRGYILTLPALELRPLGRPVTIPTALPRPAVCILTYVCLCGSSFAALSQATLYSVGWLMMTRNYLEVTVHGVRNVVSWYFPEGEKTRNSWGSNRAPPECISRTVCFCNVTTVKRKENASLIPALSEYGNKIETVVVACQNYWVLGLCLSSGILETRKYKVSENGSVSVLRLRGGRHLLSWVTLKELTSIVQWLMLALSKRPNWVGVFPPSPEDGNRSSFRNVVFSSF
jgi:hypothetical protein